MGLATLRKRKQPPSGKRQLAAACSDWLFLCLHKAYLRACWYIQTVCDWMTGGLAVAKCNEAEDRAEGMREHSVCSFFPRRWILEGGGKTTWKKCALALFFLVEGWKKYFTCSLFFAGRVNKRPFEIVYFSTLLKSKMVTRLVSRLVSNSIKLYVIQSNSIWLIPYYIIK